MTSVCSLLLMDRTRWAVFTATAPRFKAHIKRRAMCQFQHGGIQSMPLQKWCNAVQRVEQVITDAAAAAKADPEGVLSQSRVSAATST